MLEHDKQLAAEVAQKDAEVRKEAEAIADDIAPKEQAGETSGKLIVKEEVAVGHVGWHASAWFLLFPEPKIDCHHSEILLQQIGRAHV